jgi:hypothetical protein
MISILSIDLSLNPVYTYMFSCLLSGYSPECLLVIYCMLLLVLLISNYWLLDACSGVMLRMKLINFICLKARTKYWVYKTLLISQVICCYVGCYQLFLLT